MTDSSLAALMESRRALPIELKPPPKGKIGFRRGLHIPPDFLPLAELPKGLAVRQGNCLQPPKFHYGWPYTNAHLTDVGDRRGFLVKRTNNPDIPRESNIHEMETQRCLQEAVRTKLGITSIKPELHVVLHIPCILVSLWTNWHDSTDNPPEEDVEKIRKFLEFEDSPGWYVDAEGNGKWRVRNFTSAPVPRPETTYGISNFV